MGKHPVLIPVGIGGGALSLIGTVLMIKDMALWGLHRGWFIMAGLALFFLSIGMLLHKSGLLTQAPASEAPTIATTGSDLGQPPASPPRSARNDLPPMDQETVRFYLIRSELDGWAREADGLANNPSVTYEDATEWWMAVSKWVDANLKHTHTVEWVRLTTTLNTAEGPSGVGTKAAAVVRLKAQRDVLRRWGKDLTRFAVKPPPPPPPEPERVPRPLPETIALRDDGAGLRPVTLQDTEEPHAAATPFDILVENLAAHLRRFRAEAEAFGADSTVGHHYFRWAEDAWVHAICQMDKHYRDEWSALVKSQRAGVRSPGEMFREAGALLSKFLGSDQGRHLSRFALRDWKREGVDPKDVDAWRREAP